MQLKLVVLWQANHYYFCILFSDMISFATVAVYDCQIVNIYWVFFKDAVDSLVIIG